MPIQATVGTEPTAETTIADALVNVGYFIAELHEMGVGVELGRRVREKDGAGRWAVMLRRGDREVLLRMPGQRIDRVRYVASRGQDPYDFPRLYVGDEAVLWSPAMALVEIELGGGDDLDA